MPPSITPVPTLDQLLEQAIDNVCQDLSRFKNASFMWGGKSDEQIVRMIKSASTGPSAPTYPIVMEAMRLVLRTALVLAAEKADLLILKNDEPFAAVKYTSNFPGEETLICLPNRKTILDIEKLFA